MTVRHVGGGLTVRSRRRLRIPAPDHGGTALTSIAALLAICLTALFTARPGAWASAADGPCPARSSEVATTAGHTLRVRAEPGASTLLHLCAGTSIGPVRAWLVTTGRSPAAVQRLGERLALAAAPLRPGQRSPVSVDAVLESGAVVHFGTLVTVPSMHP
ncbi:hypothetical protein JIG36_01665 [Actinoplanes sp. LDG1-06]|uniref:Uncharacterized protein n=1 Tax=Paractinoplanes ovalisporus TaxID=2810368 RepID=A0ABS2A340_9ACTN|nr:hypothetical protein [Actinoplanes ovalisporus]MBM2614261.1 hypothetical protein [Actinoplanes ovalisporus]